MPSQTYTFSTAQPLTLRLRNPAGDVEITASDTTETTVEVIPRGHSAQDPAERTRVELSADGTRLDVEAPERRFGSTAKLGMIVQLPAGSRVDVGTASADLVCHGRLGRLDAATASGDIAADEIDGNAGIKTASGDVVVGGVSGDVDCKTASGDLRLGSAGGNCRSMSASGNVELGACGGEVSARTASGDVAVRQVERGSVQISTMSGDVKVGVRRGVTVWLDLSTMSGRTRSDLEHQDTPPSDDSAVLSISVRTMSGDIALQRSNLPSQSHSEGAQS